MKQYEPCLSLKSELNNDDPQPEATNPIFVNRQPTRGGPQAAGTIHQHEAVTQK